MATTSTTSATTTNSSSQIMAALGAGSGIDIKSLAQNLVDAEKAPRKDRIDAKITETESRITGYNALKFSLSDLRLAYEKLNDASDFRSVTASSSQSSALKVTAGAGASPGAYSISVDQTARATRWASQSAFTTSTGTIGGDVTLSFSLGDLDPDTSTFTEDTTRAFSVTVTDATPAGIVAAVNAQTADTGIRASLLNTGSGGYKVIFSGQEGQDNHFTVSSDNSAFAMPATTIQSARDAKLTVDGIEVTRSANSITDLIDGVTLDLYGTTSSAARVDLVQDTTTIKDNLRALVTAYNAFNDGMEVMADRSSKAETYGGALAGDSLLQQIRVQMRSMVSSSYKIYEDPDNPVDPPLNPNIYAGWQIGLSFDRYGKLSLDEAKLDKALATYPQEVSRMFSAGTDNKSVYATGQAGLAGTAVRDIDKLVRSTGLIADRTKSANTQLTFHKDQLTKLDERMTQLLDRYMKQFSLMESIVGDSNSTRDSLKSTFDGMMNSKN